jgi:hypothetical protein
MTAESRPDTGGQPCCGEFLTCQRPCTPRGTNEAMQRVERMLREASKSLPPEFAKVINDNFWLLVQGHPESAIAPPPSTLPPTKGALRHCPFCGTAPRWLEAKSGFYTERVICDNCNFHFDGEHCIDSWNTRVAAQSYDAIADAVNEVAEAAQEAFRKAGLEPGEWDSDNIVQDVKRGIAYDIERLAAQPSHVAAQDEPPIMGGGHVPGMAAALGEKPVATVINNNQRGWEHIIETAPNVTLDVGTKLYAAPLSAIGAPTDDTKRLDWLSEQGVPGMLWIARPSITGRGYRLHQSDGFGDHALSRNPRSAIDVAMSAAVDVSANHSKEK